MLIRCIFCILWLAIFLPFQTAWAQLVAPNQGGEVSLTRVTATTMELRFGMTGTGQGRIVLMAAVAGSALGAMRVTDGTFYSANTNYGQGSPIGQGYVVYAGSGHSATITGLLPNTYYYIATAEFNQDSTGIAYNMRSSNLFASTRAGSVALATQSVSARQVEIYPNPSAGQAVHLVLHGYSNETCTMSLIDALGRTVANQKFIPSEATATVPFILPATLIPSSYLLILTTVSEPPLRKHFVITD